MLFQGAKEDKPKKPKPIPGGGRGGRRRVKDEQAIDRSPHWSDYEVPKASQQEEHFRHGHWSARRNKIRRHLQNAGTTNATLNRWDGCGGQCYAEFSESRNKIRLAANYCKHRSCEPCMRAKANLIARNLREKLEEVKKTTSRKDPIGCRFITVTLRHTKQSLQKQIKRLTEAFKKLRNTKEWKASQAGGAATLEVKWTGTAWHPHLHIVSEGTYINKFTLSALWETCTGDSKIVDIQALKNEQDACHYLVKYITKGTSPAVWDNDDLAQEWIVAMRGVRICNTFGSWRGFKLLNRTPGVKDWKPLGSLEEIIARAQSGELAAQGILIQLRPPGQEQDIARKHTPGP